MEKFLEKIKKDKISEYSAQSAFYIILSITPFVLVFISFIQYTNIEKDTLIFYAKKIIPNSFQDLSLNIIEELYSKTITTLSISIIFTIWSASRGFFAIMKGINSIYNSENKSYLHGKIRAFLFTIVFIFLLIILLMIIVFGNDMKNLLKSTQRNNINQDSMYLGGMGVALTIFSALMFLYKYIPNCKLRFKGQIVGAAFVTILWYVLSYAFSIYIQVYNGFSLVYGSLTTIILFMLWIYCIIYIIFLGAEINYYLKK